MKKSVKETLKLAVEQLFIRIHGDLFNKLSAGDKALDDPTALIYDETNKMHVSLVTLCKEKIGYEPLATNQDIFFSIMQVYKDAREKERKQSGSNK